MTDDARVILARRARLIAAALAGAGLGAGCGGTQTDKPKACLESPAASPEVIVPEPEAEPGEDAGALPSRQAVDAGATPAPEEPPTRPRICLDFNP